MNTVHFCYSLCFMIKARARINGNTSTIIANFFLILKKLLHSFIAQTENTFSHDVCKVKREKNIFCPKKVFYRYTIRGR